MSSSRSAEICFIAMDEFKILDHDKYEKNKYIFLYLNNQTGHRASMRMIRSLKARLLTGSRTRPQYWFKSSTHGAPNRKKPTVPDTVLLIGLLYLHLWEMSTSKKMHFIFSKSHLFTLNLMVENEVDAMKSNFAKNVVPLRIIVNRLTYILLMSRTEKSRQEELRGSSC